MRDGTAPRMLDRNDELRLKQSLIVSSAFGVACSSIVLPYYTMSALVGPVTEEFGWSRSDMLLCLAFSSGLGAAVAPIVGVLIDRFGARRIALPGLIGLGAGFALASQVDGQLWLMYTAYAVMAIFGGGTIPVTWSRAITTNFAKRRGLALGIALSGTGVCGAFAPNYTVWLSDEFGWRVAYLGLAALPLFLAAPIVFTWFHPDKSANNSANGEPTELDLQNAWGYTLGEALGQYRYWALLLSIFAIYMAVSGLVPNLIPALTEGDAMSRTDAASVVGFFGGAIVVGRLLIGYLVDRYWAPGVAALTLCLPVIGSIILIGTPDYPLAVLAVVMIGLAAGAELDLMAFLAAQYFGLRHYAKIYSLLYAALAICSGSSSWIFGKIYESTQSYSLAFQIGAVLFAVGAVLVLTMGRYPEQSRIAAP